MKTYQVSMETIGDIDDTMEAEDGEMVTLDTMSTVVFNQTAIKANWCRLPMTVDFLLTRLELELGPS